MSLSGLPKKDIAHIFCGSLSSSLLICRASSSDCSSVPTVGVTSVSISTRIRCSDGACAFRRMPNCPPCRTISGASIVISAIVGDTSP